MKTLNTRELYKAVKPLCAALAGTLMASQAVPTQAAESPLKNPDAVGIHQVCADLNGATMIVYATNKGGMFGSNYYLARVYNDTPVTAGGVTYIDVIALAPGKVKVGAHFQARPFSIAPELTFFDQSETNFVTQAPSGRQILDVTRAVAEVAHRDAATRNLAQQCLYSQIGMFFQPIP